VEVEQLWSKLRGCAPEINVRLWIYRDGLAPHFGRQFAEYVNESYQGRWVRAGGPVAWPSRSPDFNALDFFIWSERSLCWSHNGLLDRKKAAAGRVQHIRNRCLRKKQNGRHSVETLNGVTRGGMLDASAGFFFFWRNSATSVDINVRFPLHN